MKAVIYQYDGGTSVHVFADDKLAEAKFRDVTESDDFIPDKETAELTSDVSIVVYQPPVLWPLRTHGIILMGSTAAAKAALYLVNRSTWFQIEPLPDDQWELTVKEEVPLPLQFIPEDRLFCIRMRPAQQHQQQ